MTRDLSVRYLPQEIVDEVGRFAPAELSGRNANLNGPTSKSRSWNPPPFTRGRTSRRGNAV